MGAELLTTGSILAAFFAGGVALFAPCCIVFLAPSYLAGAVKNRRWRLLPLTFIFAAGLAVVLVPITLGMSLLAGAIARYHVPLYIAGGVLMFALAALSFSGTMWSLPSFLRAPDTSRGDTASFFSLGVFSGVASSCCAPVLAGVMTLSVLSGSAAGGLALGLAYVFGMVFPLFVMALVWDRARLGERKLFRARPVRVRVAGRVIATNSLNIAVAVGFVVMGVFVIALAGDTDMTGGTAAQDAAASTLTDVFLAVQAWVSPIPEPVLGMALLALAAVFVWATLAGRRPRGSAHGATPVSPEAGVLPVEGHPSLTGGPAGSVEAPSCHSSATEEEVVR
ncbi:cytochrome c biogenesis CcdA family protein [Actinotalea solisilvae]|uniref:cytochrome c biogenesis CcdA family protein n=1 Tax=Actinotalea solisilvae TaxID=2072922 RepID=UPI0018F1D1EA|nr:cytochrome c biogenesis protein CcdA [Actinotalea solisilvae]